MALIEWVDALNLDIDIIDKQHQVLVGMINDLHDDIVADEQKERVAKRIEGLSIYAAMHFSREEHYFEVYRYQAAEKHKREHAAFDEKISLFEEACRAGKQDLSMDILQFLAGWLVNHVNGSDRKYAPLLRANGLV